MNRLSGRLLIILIPLMAQTARAEDDPLVQPSAEAPPTTVAQSAPQAAGGESDPASQSAAVVAATPAPAAAPKHFWERMTYNGMIDFFGIANLADPTSNVNKARSFDAQHGGGLQLNYAEVALELPAAPIGFRLDVGFGNAANVLYATDPSSNPASGANPNHALWHRNIQQAYLSFRIPVLRGITIDAGKFVTPVGFEPIESRDNWNYSRSLLFSWANPYFHTGLRVTMPLSDTLTVVASWVNGWNTFVLEGSNMRTGHVQLAWNPRPWVSLIAQYMGGYSGAPNVRVGGDKVRHLVDLIAIFKPTDKLSLALNGDYGYDDGNQWGGVAAYARYQFLPWFASAFRGEVLADPDGFAAAGGMLGNGEGQTLWEVTVTAAEVGFSLGKANVLLRAEYRHDQSNVAFFDGKAPDGMPASAAIPRKSQDTITGALISYF